MSTKKHVYHDYTVTFEDGTEITGQYSQIRHYIKRHYNLDIKFQNMRNRFESNNRCLSIDKLLKPVGPGNKKQLFSDVETFLGPVAASSVRSKLEKLGYKVTQETTLRRLQRGLRSIKDLGAPRQYNGGRKPASPDSVKRIRKYWKDPKKVEKSKAQMYSGVSGSCDIGAFPGFQDDYERITVPLPPMRDYTPQSSYRRPGS